MCIGEHRAREITAGVVPVQAATVGAFVPQMLNNELVGGVDFKKGCYPGQEIVARSHYLGKLKRRGVVLSAGAEASGAQAGQEYCSRSSRRRIFPEALRGSALMNSTVFGVL